MNTVPAIHTQVRERVDEIRSILRAHHVEKAWLFGSAVNGRFNEQSDLDILIEMSGELNIAQYSENYWNTLFELEDRLQRKIDLLTVSSLHNECLIKEIDSNKVEIL